MLHVCVSGALYRPVEDSVQKKPTQSRDTRFDFKENLGHLSSSEDQLSRRCLEDLFLDDAIRDKNRANTIDSKLGKFGKFRKQNTHLLELARGHPWGYSEGSPVVNVVFLPSLLCLIPV